MSSGGTFPVPGLDVIWYFRRWRAQFGKAVCPEEIGDHYKRNVRNILASPNLVFDEFWYRQRYPNVERQIAKGHFQSGWEHYLKEGCVAGYNPAYWFDENWYLRHNSDAWRHSSPVVCGFEHYIRYGVLANASPSLYFNPAWYRSQYLTSDDSNRVPLVDYLNRPSRRRPTPVPFFDTDWYWHEYMQHDGADLKGSAYEHYIFVGRVRGYSASADFDEADYRFRYPAVRDLIAKGTYATALEHYASEGVANGYRPSTHHRHAGLDYRSPVIVQSYANMVRIGLRQIAAVKRLASTLPHSKGSKSEASK